MKARVSDRLCDSGWGAQGSDEKKEKEEFVKETQLERGWKIDESVTRRQSLCCVTLGLVVST